MGKHPIADIPGLIEGASKGRGLGIAFLKHIEKTKVLVHCVDSTQENVEKAYETVHNELAEHNISLLDKPEIILLTKIDLSDEKTIKNNIKILKKKGMRVLTSSIYDQKSLDQLKQALESIL
jgi:GTP-binding protein